VKSGNAIIYPFRFNLHGYGRQKRHRQAAQSRLLKIRVCDSRLLLKNSRLSKLKAQEKAGKAALNAAKSSGCRPPRAGGGKIPAGWLCRQRACAAG